MTAIEKEASRSILSKYVLETTYARWLPEEDRSESFSEVVARALAMHLRRFPQVAEELRWAFRKVLEGTVLPAMRSLQYAGGAIEKNHARMYNNWATHIDRPEVFGQALFLLLSGGGIGFSIQRRHVEKLPAVPPASDTLELRVEDSIEGWARALGALVEGRFNGVRVSLDTSDIRPEGAPCVTSGGFSPGAAPLSELLSRAHRIFDQAEGRPLRPIECYDLLCHIAEAASADDVGRAAMLALFSPDDDEMLEAKSGRWYETHPFRRRSNNSAALLRGLADRAAYDRIVLRSRAWGEPGIFWTSDLDVCTNSCGESGFYPVLEVAPGERRSGWQGCTLSEINGAALRNLEDFEDAARAAAIINTVQAAYTQLDDMLGPVTRLLCERDALLGVGITGLADNPGVAWRPGYQRAAAEVVRRTNREIAGRLGIRPAKRTTLIKPAGKSSLLFGGVSPGLHGHHDARYLMRVVPRRHHPASERFKLAFPQHLDGEGRRERIVFALAARPGSMCRSELTAVRFLRLIESTLLHWVLPGGGDDPVCAGIANNASNTVSVRDHEWEEVAEYLWNHQDTFSGVTLMSYSGDLSHPLAPLQSLYTGEDRALWERLRGPAPAAARPGG